MSDPITIVYNALWAELESNSEFCALVPVGNRIKFSGNNRAPAKDTKSTNDYPEVRIVSQGSALHAMRNSNASSLTKNFSIQVSTGDRRLDALLFPLEWVLFKVLATCLDSMFVLTFGGQTFVRAVKCAQVTDIPADTFPSIQGWASLWTVNVEMWFATNSFSGV